MFSHGMNRRTVLKGLAGLAAFGARAGAQCPSQIDLGWSSNPSWQVVLEAFRDPAFLANASNLGKSFLVESASLEEEVRVAYVLEPGLNAPRARDPSLETYIALPQKATVWKIKEAREKPAYPTMDIVYFPGPTPPFEVKYRSGNSVARAMVQVPEMLVLDDYRFENRILTSGFQDTLTERTDVMFLYGNGTPAVAFHNFPNVKDYQGARSVRVPVLDDNVDRQTLQMVDGTHTVLRMPEDPNCGGEGFPEDFRSALYRKQDGLLGVATSAVEDVRRNRF